MIGVVGPAGERIATALDRAGATTRHRDASTVVEADPELAVTVGQDAAIDLLEAGLDAPLLPVDGGFGPLDVPVESVIESAGELHRGEFDVSQVPTLSVSQDSDHVGRALFDVTLVTSDPARISEYRIGRDGKVAQFRADGLVVSTPVGSRGYASNAGGPIVAADRDVAAVVPIGAFTMARNHWVFDLERSIEVTVTRAENDVSLLLDGREARVVTPVEPITIRAGEPLQIAALDVGDGG